MEMAEHRVAKAQDAGQPVSAEPRGLLNAHICAFAGSVLQQIFIKYFIPALQDLTG